MADKPKCGVVSSGTVQKFGRLDAPFALLAEYHRPVAEELLEKLTLEELVQFAKDLPYDHEAAAAVCLGRRWTYRSNFEKWLDRQLKAKNPNRVTTDVAVYCAAAAQCAASKILEEMLEITKQKLAKAQQLRALLDGAKAKGLKKTFEAMKHGGKKEDVDGK